MGSIDGPTKWFVLYETAIFCSTAVFYPYSELKQAISEGTGIHISS